MRRLPVLIGFILFPTLASAQSRVDQAPTSQREVPLPLKPHPSDETSDQPATAYPPPEVVPQSPEPPTRLVLPGATTDTLSNHFLLGLSGGYTNAFGSLDSQTSALDRVSGGYLIGVSAGYGLSRYVELELIGTMTSWSSPTECPSCTAKTYGALGAVRYHLVQGVRFDPWVRFGVGVNVLRLQAAGVAQNYAGIQWFTGTVGGDWYFNRHFALGPVLSLALTSHVDHPTSARASIAGQWLVGLNLVLDPTGK